jgi:hypothetical protein
LLYLKGHVFMSETASVTGQKSQESGIQSVPVTQGTTQAHNSKCPICKRNVTVLDGTLCQHGPGKRGEFLCSGGGRDVSR